MKRGRIVIITGAPGTGKTTVSEKVARESHMEKSVNMHTDDFYHYLGKGAIPPHLPESKEQNLIVIEAFLEAAKRYARGGYEVIVDGIVGVWFLEPWLKTAREGYEVHYIVLRASKDQTMKRAIERSKLDRKTNIELVETMWEQFSHLGCYEPNVIDTTHLSIEETVSIIQEKITEKSCLLKTEGLPGQVQQVISVASGLFGDQIVGMYLYGSYVLGGLRLDSDIDILIVADGKISDAAREELTGRLLRCSGRVGCTEKRPLEVTVVNQADVDSGRLAECEYMYGEWLREEIEEGKIPQACHDDDMTILLWQARAHSIVLQGKEADAAIPPVSCNEVRKAMQKSLPGLIAHGKGDERNVLLTLSRMWFTLETEDICPKDVAAEWVIPKLPDCFVPLMELAVKGYRGESVDEWSELENETLLFMDYLKNTLEGMLESDDQFFR